MEKSAYTSQSLSESNTEQQLKKILFFTDLHFGIHSNSQKYINICTDTVSWIKDVCKNNSVTDVIFGGDFFDSRSSIDVRLMSIATQSLYSLADSNIKVYMILGNHDIYLRDATDVNSLLAYNANRNVEIVDKPKWLNDGKILLLPWGYGTVKNEIEYCGKETFVFCHQDFPKEFFIGGRSKKSDTDVSDKFSEFGFQKELINNVIKNNGNIFSGHIHHPSKIPLSDKSSIIIVGSPYETEFGFKGVPCGTFLIDIDNSKYEFIENPYNRKHIELHTSNIDLELEKTDVSNNFIRLVVDTQESFENISDIQRKIANKNPYHMFNTVFEFNQAAFVGNRDEIDNPLQSVNDSKLSKVDYVNDAIDKADFSNFTYEVEGKTVSVDKNELKKLTAEIFEKIGAKR